MCIVDRSKVLRIRRDILLPDVRSPTKTDILHGKQLTSDSTEELTQPYSSRSNRRPEHPFTPANYNLEDGFRNVRTFALSKNTC